MCLYVCLCLTKQKSFLLGLGDNSIITLFVDLLPHYIHKNIGSSCLFIILFNSSSCYPPVLIDNAAGSLPSALFE